jgi:hypothetical protein
MMVISEPHTDAGVEKASQAACESDVALPWFTLSGELLYATFFPQHC